jgi:hypothetical protein
MKCALGNIVGLLFTVCAFTQNVHPGGVRSPAYWFISDSSNRVPSFKNQTTKEFIQLANGAIQLLNFRPALFLNGQSELAVDVANSDMSKASYFTVYQCLDHSKENVIWYASKNNQAGLVLTTSRMADLTDYKYLNYTDRLPRQPKINVYVQHKRQDSLPPFSQYFTLGNAPHKPQLPITPFKGMLPEFIIYDRVLTSQELLQVSSYLAIKYGITLSEPEATYLNSAGDVIWDGYSYSDFHNNIAGLARDDSSGLLQKAATSSNSPNLLTLTTADILRNKASTLWGDNNLPLTEGEKISGLPPMFLREWKIVHTNLTDSLQTDVLFDTKQIDALTPVKPVFWIAIDRSGTGDYSLEGTEFIKMAHLDRAMKATFKNVVWAKNSSYTERFRFLVGDPVLFTTRITPPTCASPHSGALQIKIWGAALPHRLQVLNSHNRVIKDILVPNSEPISIADISAGRYMLHVQDAQGQSSKDAIVINSIDAPVPESIHSSYMLPPGQNLELDASQNLSFNATYSWRGPHEFYSTSEKVRLRDAGLYTLTVTRNGCTYIKDFVIKQLPKNIFTKILISPNPSPGDFTVKISLDKVASVGVTLFTEDGRHIKTVHLEGFANYSFTEHLGANGLYFLVCRSGLSVSTQKIVIHK